jgi:hypothetical protein
MNGNKNDERLGMTERLMSRFARDAKPADSLDLSASDLGQNYPQHCPQPEREIAEPSPNPLGDPMTIRQVATFMSCSVWTVRQRYLPAGLPHFRLSRNGKLVFYRNQIVRWVLEKQRQKGGIIG